MHTRITSCNAFTPCICNSLTVYLCISKYIYLFFSTRPCFIAAHQRHENESQKRVTILTLGQIVWKSKHTKVWALWKQEKFSQKVRAVSGLVGDQSASFAKSFPIHYSQNSDLKRITDITDSWMPVIPYLWIGLSSCNIPNAIQFSQFIPNWFKTPPWR